MKKLFFLSLIVLVAFLLQCSRKINVTQPPSPQVSQETETTPSINKVELSQSEEGINLTIESDNPLMYTAYSAETNSPNLVIDIPGAVPAEIPAWIDSDIDLIKNVQVEAVDEENSKPLTRISVSLAQGFDYQIDHQDNKLIVNFAPLADLVTPSYQEENTKLNQEPEEVEEEIPATAISKIIVRRIDEDVMVSILGDGKLSYKSFMLEEPYRLIIDIDGTQNNISPPAQVVDSAQLYQIRTSQFKVEPEMVSRVVFDLNYLAKYQIISEEHILKVYLSKERAEKMEEAVAESLVEEVAEEEPEFVEEKPVEEKKPPEEAVVEPKAEVQPQLPREEEKEAIPGEVAQQVPLTFKPQRIPGEERQYTGQPISLEFRDIDIRDVIHLFATITGLNFVIDPEVGGRITIYLKDVPWDQALDIVLKNNGLGKVFENNVVRIATTGKLSAEARAQAELIEQRRLAVPLDTLTRAVSYAKAMDLEPVVKKNLSARGDVIVDARTNTLIIKDIPDQIAILRTLIDTLDIPAKQVMIESRIVETTRLVLQGLGIQWGFSAVQDRAHGNTTSLIFPNSYKAEGASAGLTRFGIGGTPYAVNLPTQLAATTSVGVTFGNLIGSFNLDATLHLLESTNQARILSRPQITTQNNIEGVIRSGYRIPVQTAVALGVVSVTYIDAALKMTVTPQITADNTIIMDVEVSNDTPTGRLIGPNAEISTRSATSRLLVPDGGTAVIGGIIQMRDVFTQERTPLLHRIPILGWLFKNRNLENRNDELIVFITPRILSY